MVQDLTALARLMPVALNLAPPAPSIDWGDFGELRFRDPFFEQTVSRWAASEPRPQLLRSGLGVLAEFDGTLGCDPCALIFHMSRCGSTWLSRLLSTLPQTLVISEPSPVNALLSAMKAGADQATQAQALRCLVRALGCRRFGETFYLLKLSSWNIRFLSLFRLAFPAAKIVFVQRDPEAVMASIRADAPGWLKVRDNAAQARALFGAAAGDAVPPDADAFAAHALAAMLDAARAAAFHGALIVDYAELAAAAWLRVAPFCGIDLTADDIARMHDEARYYAKDPGRRLFTGDPPERRRIDARAHELVAAIVEPVYRDLDRWRRQQIPERHAPAAAQNACL
jgi:hypothetical protein